MATSTIFADITIKGRAEAERFIKAIEESKESSETKPQRELKQYKTIKNLSLERFKRMLKANGV